MTKILLLWLGGGLGTLARYLLSNQFQHWFGLDFPYGTLGVNLLGCFAIGILAELLTQTSLHADIRLFLMTGLLGGFTTFSAFGLETITLFQVGSMVSALWYVAASILLGLLSVWGGILTAKTLLPVA